MAKERKITLSAALSPDYKAAFQAATAIAKDADKDLKALAKTQEKLLKLQDLSAEIQRADSGETVKNIEKKRREFAMLSQELGVADGNAEELAKRLDAVAEERAELESLKRTAGRDVATARAIDDIEKLQKLTAIDPKYADNLKKAQARARALGVELDEVGEELKKPARQRFAESAAKAINKTKDIFKSFRAEMKKPIKEQFSDGIKAGFKATRAAADMTWKALKKGAAVAARGAVAAFKKAGPAIAGALGKGAKFAGGAALGAVGAVAGGIGGALSSAEEQAEQYRLASAAGLSREDFSDALAAFKAYALDGAALMDLTKTTQERIAEAAQDWQSDQGKIFARLGFTREGLQGMQSADALKAIADAVQAIENSSERTKATEDLLGGDARILLEDLRVKGKSFSGYLEEFKGKGLKGDEIEALEKSAEMMRNLKQNLAEFVARFLKIIAPALEKMMPAVQSLAAAFEPMIPPLMRGAGFIVSLLGHITRGVGKIVTYIGEIGKNDYGIIDIGRAIESAGTSMIDVKDALSVAADALESDINRRKAAEAEKTNITINYTGTNGEKLYSESGGGELVSKDAALSSVVSLGQSIAKNNNYSSVSSFGSMLKIQNVSGFAE